MADSFQIMTYEWTNSQYVNFLNAVDPNGTNPNVVYHTVMGSDARGGISFAGGNAAVWNGEQGNVTTVGTNGGPSAYGTFDMSGNVGEWNDVTGAAGSNKGIRGGFWRSNSYVVSSSSRELTYTNYLNDTLGFRLAGPAPLGVPEPSTWAMGLAGIACAGWGAFRRRTRA